MKCTDECGRKAKTRGLCMPCYRQRWRAGTLPTKWMGRVGLCTGVRLQPRLRKARYSKASRIAALEADLAAAREQEQQQRIRAEAAEAEARELEQQLERH